MTAPFWEGCRSGRLTLQRCARCHRFIHFPQPSCPACGSGETGWEPVDPHGRLLTFTEVHRTFAPGFEDAVPYVVAVLELDVAPAVRIVAGVEGVAPDRLVTGAPMRVGFTERTGFGPVPVLRPVHSVDHDSSQ